MASTAAPGAGLQAPSATGPNLAAIPTQGVTLRFDNADVYEVLQAVLGDILKLDYVIDPSVQGRITLKSSQAVNQADIYSVLEAALATVNISIVRNGNMHKVVRDANAVRERLASEGIGAASPVMQIIPVRFVQANQLVNTLRNFIGTQAAITSDPTNRYLIVADRSGNVDKILEMVKTLDVDYLSHVHIRLLPVHSSDPADVARELDALFKSSGLFNWTGTEAIKIHTLPIPRLGAVLVGASNQRLVEAAEQWVKALDSAPRNGLAAFVHVHPVANGSATRLAELLQQVFTGTSSGATGASTTTGQTRPAGAPATTTTTTSGGVGSSTSNQPTTTISRGNVPTAQGVTGGGPGLGGQIQIIPDEFTNSLIIRASAADYQQLKRVIDRLDTVPRQVLIQVMVAEVSLNDTLQYGVEWWVRQRASNNGRSWTGMWGLDGSIRPPTTGQVTGTGSGLNYTILNGAGQVIGLLNLLGKDTNVNVLSAPHVLASDGKLAKIEVGNDEPVITQTVSTPTTNTGTLTTSNAVQYRPTGILLEVKPNISASGLVTMNISQEVSSRAGSVSVGGSEYPNFSKRKVATDVTVEEGKSIVIAGLIQDRGEGGVTGVPGLKDIPLFGALFGTTNKQRNKTELIMTITPYIVKTRDEGERLTRAFQDSLGELKERIGSDKLSIELRQPALQRTPTEATRPAP